MLGSCAGHYRLWPLTSPLFHWRHQSGCLVSAMSPLFTQWQFSSPAVTLEPTQLAGSHFLLSTSNYGAFWWKAAVHHCGRGLFRTRQWNPKNSPSEKGICLAKFSRQLITAPLYSSWGDKFLWTTRVHVVIVDRVPGCCVRSAERGRGLWLFLEVRWLKDLLTRLL